MVSRFVLKFGLVIIALAFQWSLIPLKVQSQSFLSKSAYLLDSTSDEFQKPLIADGELAVVNQVFEQNQDADDQPIKPGELGRDVSGDSHDTLSQQLIYGGLSEAVLDEVSVLIEQGENNQALAYLERIPELLLEDSEVESNRVFNLNETRSYLAIKANYHLGNLQDVEALAEGYFNQFTNGDHFFWVYYYLSSTLYAQKKPLRFVYFVTEDFFSNLPNRERQNLRLYLIENSLQSKEYLSAINFLEDENGSLVSGYEKWIDEIIENLNEVEDIEQIINRFKNEEINSQLVLRKTQLLIREGNLEEAKRFYENLASNIDIESESFDDYPEVYRAIRLAEETDPLKIGVILPVTHRAYKRYARETLDGLELALKDFSIEGKKIQLVIKDSAQLDSTPEFRKMPRRLQRLAKQRLVKTHIQDLVENDGVIAVLGPLARDTSIAAGEAAEEYQIPVISFSMTENIGEELKCLFRFQQNRFHEARTLADYAVDYLNSKRFVILYQNRKKDFVLMETFQQEIEKKGGVVVGIAEISKKQADFNDTFLSFTNGFRKRSEEEIEELKKTRERPQPVLDFDAIYLPTDLRTLKVVIDFAKLFDAENVWFLAGNRINQVGNQLLTSTRRLRFVDTFPVSSVKTYLQPFFETHWKYYNYRSVYDPPTDYTIYGYEAFEILSKLLSNPRFHNREALKNAVESLKSFKVMTGTVNANGNGELAKELKILKISDGNTVEVF